MPSKRGSTAGNTDYNIPIDNLKDCKEHICTLLKHDFDNSWQISYNSKWKNVEMGQYLIELQ